MSTDGDSDRTTGTEGPPRGVATMSIVRWIMRRVALMTLILAS